MGVMPRYIYIPLLRAYVYYIYTLLLKLWIDFDSVITKTAALLNKHKPDCCFY